MITQVETIQTQMVEFDSDVRYLRINTPGAGDGYNWFVPVSDGETFRFVLIDINTNKELEAAFLQYIGITQ